MANMLPTLQAFVNQNLSAQQAAESLSAIALDPSALTLANDGSRMTLNVIEGTHNRHAVHNPSYCFAGAGWKIEYPENIDLSHEEGAGELPRSRAPSWGLRRARSRRTMPVPNRWQSRLPVSACLASSS